MKHPRAKYTEVTDSAINSTRTYIAKGEEADPLFALCDVLHIPAQVVAKQIGVSKAQMTYYRKGLTPIPQNRIGPIVYALGQALYGIKWQLEQLEDRQKHEKSSALTKAIVADLKGRISLAYTISEECLPSANQEFELGYDMFKKERAKDKKSK